MRNTVLALAAAGSLTFLAITPALAVGVCSHNPNLDNCPIYGVYGKTTPPTSSFYQVRPRSIRHAQSRHVRPLHPGSEAKL
jgi:hypothetical protein